MLHETKGPPADFSSVHFACTAAVGLQMVHAIVAIETKPFSSISLCCYGVFGVAARKLLF